MKVLKNIKSHKLLQTQTICRYCNKKKLTKKSHNFYHLMKAVDIIKLKKTCTNFLFTFNLIYVIFKKINPPFINQNSQFILGVISSFELQIITIANFKPHKLFDSSIFNFDETTFCFSGLNFDGATFCSRSLNSNGTTFCFPIIYFYEVTFCF